MGTFDAHGGRAHDGTTCGLEFTHTGGVERMDSSNRFAVQCCIQLAPLAGGCHGTDRQIHGRNHLRNDHGVGGEHLAQQGDGGLSASALAGSRNWASHGFLAGIVQHGASQHVFGLGMGGYTKPWHINTNDAYTVDFLGQQLQRNTAGGGYAQIDDDDAIELVGIGLFVHSVADVFKQFTGDQGFRVERHIAHGAACAVKMRGECETVHTTGRAAQDGGCAAHAQTHAQRTKSRTHALRLVVRAFGVVGCVLRQHFALTRFGRRVQHLFFARMTTQAICAGSSSVG